MDIIECYRLLELTSTASLEDVKSSYRRLARQLHPDVNPNNLQAHEQFIRITEAYKVLSKIASANAASTSVQTAPSPPPSPPVPVPTVTVTVQPPSPPIPEPAPKKRPQATPPTTSPPPEQAFADRRLKMDIYRQLEDLIKRRKFPRAIAMIEALQTRLPDDPEVRQWQAIIYQRWGRQLIHERKLNQARAYLKKALKTDPHNKSLWTEVEADFRRIETVY